MLQILNTNFEKVCEITTYKSILWHELFLDESGGDFQLELPAEKYMPFIRKDYYIVNSESEKFGIIDTYQIDDTQEKAIITVSGEMGESILKRRIIFPTMTLSGSLDKVVNSILNRHVINPDNTARKIANFVYISDSTASGRVSKQITGKRVSQTLVSLCGLLGYSYLVRLNSNLTGFELVLKQGIDRSISQAENEKIEFTVDDYGVSDFRYLTSNKSSYSHVIAAGEGDGLSRKYVVYPSYSYESEKGLNRKEVFLDCSGISSDAGEDEIISELEYYDKLETEARSELQKSSTETACEGTIHTHRYQYGKDFGLGDVVSVTDAKLDIGYDTRTLGALLCWDENGAHSVIMEMGDLSVEDVSDEPEEPEEDEVIEQEEEETESAITRTLQLNDSLFPFLITESTLNYCNLSGEKIKTKRGLSGSLYVYDNMHLQFNVACSEWIVRQTEDQTDTLGNLVLSLPKSVYGLIGGFIETALDGFRADVLVASSTFTMHYSETIPPETDEDGNLISDTYQIVFNTTLPLLDSSPCYCQFSHSQLLEVEEAVTFAIMFGADTIDRYLEGNYMVDTNTGSVRAFANCGIYGESVIDYSRWDGDALLSMTIDYVDDLEYGVDYTMDSGTIEWLLTGDELRTKYEISDNQTDVVVQAKVQRQLNFYGTIPATAGEYTSWDIIGYKGFSAYYDQAATLDEFNNSIGGITNDNMVFIGLIDSAGNVSPLTKDTDYTITTPTRGIGNMTITLLADHDGELLMCANRGPNLMI